jgi:hypothetical protein
MKHITLSVIACAIALLIAFPTLSQPVPEPTTKAPVTKVAPVPASAPATKVAPTPAADPVAEPVVKTEGKVEEKAVAEEPKEEMGYGAVAIKHAMDLGFLLLSLLLSGLVGVLLKKFGFQAQNEKVQAALEKGVAFAEQWAKKKAKVDGEAKPGGPDKMDQAIDFAMGLATEYKLPKKGKDWWEGQLESWLGVKNGS